VPDLDGVKEFILSCRDQAVLQALVKDCERRLRALAHEGPLGASTESGSGFRPAEDFGVKGS
jgi:hypothetical protein